MKYYYDLTKKGKRRRIATIIADKHIFLSSFVLKEYYRSLDGEDGIHYEEHLDNIMKYLKLNQNHIYRFYVGD
ncbi:MAG: hypothetical protein RR659_03800 [Bacilli bacterium]